MDFMSKARRPRGPRHAKLQPVAHDAANFGWSQTRVNTEVIRNVEAVVAVWRWMERDEPQRLDAERMQIIQPPHQPLEVADPVSIRVHIGLEIEATYESVLVP